MAAPSRDSAGLEHPGHPEHLGATSLTLPVLFAGLLTLLVTGARLLGELQEWSPTWFSREPGGRGAVIGIVWLVPVFGFLFGRCLAKAGRAPKVPGLRLLLLLVLTAALVGGVGYLAERFQGEELRLAMGYVGFGGPALVLLALLVWPRGALANLAYGVLARAPVVVVQYVSIAQEWGTHYEKVHPKLPPMSADERALGLLLAQATLWVPFTVLLGTLFAVVGTLTVRRRAD